MIDPSGQSEVQKGQESETKECNSQTENLDECAHHRLDYRDAQGAGGKHGPNGGAAGLAERSARHGNDGWPDCSHAEAQHEEKRKGCYGPGHRESGDPRGERNDERNTD